MLGVIQEQRKDFDESAAAFQRAVHLSPQRRACTARSAAHSRCRAGRSRRSRCCGKLEAYAKQRYVSPLEFAWIQFALGQTDLGFRWLTKASRRSRVRADSFKVDPRFDPLRDDRRFGAITKRLGLE